MSQVKRVTLIIVATLLLATAARADDQNVTQRLAFIEERLAARDNHADYWHDGWFVAFTAVAAGQLIAYELAPTKEMQDDYRVGAITASLGVLSASVTTNPGGNSHVLRPYPTATTAQRLSKLAAAERLLSETARGERKAHAWWNNASAVVVSTAAALVLGFHYNQPDRAATRWVSGIVVSQARFWSQPTHATRAEEEYRTRFGLEATAARPLPLRWSIIAGPRLTGIALSF